MSYYSADERINFNNPSVGKPANLQNSAVLRMLEEEERRQRSGQAPSNNEIIRPLRDQIKWPPPEFEHRNHQRSSFKDVVTPGLKRVAWPPPNEGDNYIEQAAIQSQGGPQYSSQSANLQHNYISAQQQVLPQNPYQSQRSPLQPLHISNGTTNNYQQSAISPVANPSPLGFRPATPNKQWASVQSPVSTPGQPQFKPQTPPVQSYQYQSQPQYHNPSQQYQSQNFNQHPQSVAAANQIAPQYSQPVRSVEPPPATITLRPQAPVSQAPPPVVTSQPATATLKGGKHLRGDMKWPPENVKRQVEEENRLRLELAKGPAVRPRLVRKDYGPFFAQHALNASYPGYKAPPGTQFYENRAIY